MADDDDFDFDIPEFMGGLTCVVVGCAKKALKVSNKCIDCEVKAILPALFVEIDQITQKNT